VDHEFHSALFFASCTKSHWWWFRALKELIVRFRRQQKTSLAGGWGTILGPLDVEMDYFPELRRELVMWRESNSAADAIKPEQPCVNAIPHLSVRFVFSTWQNQYSLIVMLDVLGASPGKRSRHSGMAISLLKKSTGSLLITLTDFRTLWDQPREI